MDVDEDLTLLGARFDLLYDLSLYTANEIAFVGSQSYAPVYQLVNSVGVTLADGR
jgi:hypothetical protein